ncbi:MAG TPA: YafY family protein [Ktedonobacterales bacterium]|nr:YafY family protein [Ktedonobacterales bacterium]
MYHPTTRVLTVLELLQSHHRLSGPELARRLEVDVRTVRRYVAMLQELGIPVEGGRGRYGAYRLRAGYKLPPLMFTEDEALALVVGLLAARQLGAALGPAAVEGALAKVERVLPVALRERLRSVEETLIVADAERGAPPESAVLMTLGAATRDRLRVWLRYRSWESDETEREVDPYGLVHRTGRWYMAGYCHLREGVRVFRLDRVLEVRPLATSFERPAEFDALAEVERGIASIPSAYRIEVVLETTLEAAQRHVPASVATLDPLPEGVLLRCYDQRLETTAQFLARLDCAFTVREPPELRDALRALAQRLARSAKRLP